MTENITIKTEQEIKDKIVQIETDNRMKHKKALVFVNAPLALIQCDYQAKIDALKWALGELKEIY
jgi:hypothetical protein